MNLNKLLGSSMLFGENISPWDGDGDLTPDGEFPVDISIDVT
jgi:hypothetical protein